MDEIMAPLEAMVKDVKDKLGGLSEDRPLWEIVMGFLHAVDWTEPWLIGLLSTHVILLATVVGLRKYTTLQSILFMGMVFTIWMSRRINKLLGSHWTSFAKQNYFDAEGFFISTMLSIPWLFILIIMVALYIFEASTLMVTLKRKQLIRARKQQQSQENAAPKEVKKKK